MVVVLPASARHARRRPATGHCQRLCDIWLDQYLFKSVAGNDCGMDRDISRPTVYGRLSVAQFCELHHQIDIVLDPFPYNGGTTTCDALWLGVPVVALAGQEFVSRMGYALLKNIGLPELAAASRQDYVKIAVSLD